MSSKFFFYKKVIVWGLSFVLSFSVINILLNKYLIPHHAFYSFRKHANFSNIVELKSIEQYDFAIENKEPTFIHKSLHEEKGFLNKDKLYECQGLEKQKCFIPCPSIILSNTEDPFFLSNLVVGVLPNNPESVCVNNLMARRLGVNLGDSVLLSTPMGTKQAKICGIIKDSYGILKYSEEDFTYFCIRNEPLENLHIITPCFYDKDENHLSWKSKQKELLLNFGIIYFFYFLVLILILLKFNFIYEDTIELKSYFINLKLIGKCETYIKKTWVIEYSKILIINILLCLVTNIFSWNILFSVIQIIDPFLLFLFSYLFRRKH